MLLKIFVFSATKSIIPQFKSSLLILNLGTPSKTERKVGVSSFFKSSEVDFPNKIFVADNAASSSVLPCTRRVMSLANSFCRALRLGARLCSCIIFLTSFSVFKVKILI